jgi:hypothetical protein
MGDVCKARDRFRSAVGARGVALSCSLLCWITLSGCAQVTVISDKDGPPRETWRFGVLAIDLTPSAENTIIAVKGIGLISHPSGTTIGYANAKVVRLGDECRVVISTKDLETIKSNEEELRRLLKSVEKSCVA